MRQVVVDPAEYRGHHAAIVSADHGFGNGSKGEGHFTAHRGVLLGGGHPLDVPGPNKRLMGVEGPQRRRILKNGGW